MSNLRILGFFKNIIFHITVKGLLYFFALEKRD